MELFQELHEDWQVELAQFEEKIASIEKALLNRNYLPIFSHIFRALQRPIAQARVLIVGQDPYPNPDYACGWSFSVPKEISKLPMSLRNILREVVDDVGSTCIKGGDLSPWVDQGVILLNRTLTLEAGQSHSHLFLGWHEITDQVAKILRKNEIINILWGKSAGELQSITDPLRTIVGVHPSPLSAYRGFFGSKPFSATNQLLVRDGKSEIIW